MRTLGIVLNPFSGGDGRRIVTTSPTHSVHDKVRYLSQVLHTLGEIYPVRVLLGQDLAGISSVLINPPRRFPLEVVPVTLRGEPEDTQRTVKALDGLADLLLVLGGDGTHRQALLARPQTPLLPLPAGTNNAFPFRLDSAYAGLVAAVVLRFGTGDAVYYPKVISVRSGVWESLAVVDAALYCGRFLGAHALWDPGELRHLALAFAEPWSLGLSALGALACPIDLDRRAQRGVLLSFGEKGKVVTFPWFPGHAQRVTIMHWQEVGLEEPWNWRVEEPSLLALDGERERELPRGSVVYGELRRWPVLVVDPRKVSLFLRS